MSELAQQVASKDQHKRSIEIEKGDLLESYRAVLKEHRQLEADYLAIRTAKEKLAMKVQQCQDELAEQRGVNNANDEVRIHRFDVFCILSIFR